MTSWILCRGDARRLPLADESVQCVVTSPPYWELRDYKLKSLVWSDGWRGSLGLEPTPDCGRPFMELCPDVTAAQRAFVHQRLQDAGLLDGGLYGILGIELRRSQERSEVQDMGPTEGDGGPQGSVLNYSPGSASHHDQEQPFGIPDTGAAYNPSPELANDRPSSLGEPDRQGGDSEVADILPLLLQPKSPDDDAQRASGPEASGQSFVSSVPGKEGQESSPSRCERQRSSAAPPAISRDFHGDSAKSSYRRSNRTPDPGPHRDDHIGCRCENIAWAYYILPQDILKFYRHHLCGGCYVCHLIEIFREVKRVLRNDGVIFLNMGDSYHSGNRGGYDRERSGVSKNKGAIASDFHAAPNRLPQEGLKDKDLIGIPWRLAFALQADGWWLRSAIVWSKNNPMPESIRGWRWERHRIKVGVRKSRDREENIPAGWDRQHVDPEETTGRYADDGERIEWEECPGCPRCDKTDGLILRRGSWRPTTSHEFVFLLSKSETYFCDGEAVREPYRQTTLDREDGSYVTTSNPDRPVGFRRIISHPGANKRSVWTISTFAYAEAHFATFPPALVEPCIQAGTSEKGCCPTCGAAWARIVNRIKAKRVSDRREDFKQLGRNDGFTGSPPDNEIDRLETVGFRPSCSCPPAAPIPQLVLDPFAGSGTVGLVAQRLGRRFVGVDLSAEYVTMAAKRITEDMPLFNATAF